MDVADSEAEDDVADDVGVMVRVKLNVVGTTVMMTEFRLPVRVVVVMVAVLVVKDREMEGAEVGEGVEVDDWPTTRATRAAPTRRKRERMKRVQCSAIGEVRVVMTVSHVMCWGTLEETEGRRDSDDDNDDSKDGVENAEYNGDDTPARS